MKSTQISSASITSNADVVNTTFDRIVEISKRTSKGILETGKLLKDFQNNHVVLKLNTQEHNDLEDKLLKCGVMAASTISSYRTIGECVVLWEVLDQLPPFFNHIYVLAVTEKNQPGFIRKYFASGAITPTTTLNEIKKISNAGFVTNTTSFKAPSNKVLLKVYADEDSVLQIMDEINQRLSDRKDVVLDFSSYEMIETKRQKKASSASVKDARALAYKLIKEFKRACIAKYSLAPGVKSNDVKARWIKGNGEIEEFLTEHTLSSVKKSDQLDDILDLLLAQIDHPERMEDLYARCFTECFTD